MGVCVGAGSCRSGGNSPAYHLDNLIDPAKIVGVVDPFVKIESFINKYGTYASILVLLIEGFRFVAFITCIIQTLLREGANGVIAVLYLFFCGARITADKIARRRKALRRHHKEEMPLYPIPEAPEE